MLLKSHLVNIDTDMIASSNYVRGIWDGSKLTDPVLVSKCRKVSQVFTNYFRTQNLETTPFYFNGRSDFAAFLDAGIPASGVITGEDEIKTIENVKKVLESNIQFGGLQGVVLDPCYHQDCDNVQGLGGRGLMVLEQNVKALGNVMHFFAMEEDLEAYLNSD